MRNGLMKDKLKTRFASRGIAVILLTLLLFSNVIYAQASSQILYSNDTESIEIHGAQEKLKQLGYLQSTTYVLDMNMRYALKQFCERNGLAYEDNGITQEVWNKLMSNDELVAFGEEEDPFIYYGEISDRVANIQIRLRELGYLSDEVMDLSVYDDITQRAVETFCQTNNVRYESTGISESIQTLIYSDTANAYTAEVPRWIDRVRAYLGGYILAGNVRIPNLLWLASLYIIAYLVVTGLVVLLYRGRELNKETDQNVTITGKTRTTSAQKSFYVDFQIIYKGKSRQKRCSVSKDFSIGRGNCSLKLDKSDKQVSKRHCELSFQYGSLYLKDVSRNGTYVNECPVSQTSIELSSGNRIRIGEHLLVVRY